MKNPRIAKSTYLLLLMTGMVLSVQSQQYTPPQLRTVRNLNRNWQFIRQDVAVSQATAATDPSGWAEVNLPHSFDIPYWRVGKADDPAQGWYRRHVAVDQDVIDAKKRVFIEFEAAFQYAQVYVNGQLAGTHAGGYTGFSFDISNSIKAGDNVVAVRLDARWVDTIAPRSGEHVFIGGIYRNVYLAITNPLHVTWYGTFVSTPQVSAASATVKVKTEIRNDGVADANCTVKTVVVDSTGMRVTSFESIRNVAAGATVMFVQTSDPVANPHLWSPSSPYLYKVYTEVYNGTAAVDNFGSPLGFRWIKWTTTNGFELNGERLWLQGANAHQDHAGWGDAATNAGQYRDVKLIKDCGMNFIRGSHYPKAPAFSDACDRIGVCFWSEMCYWGLQYGSTPIWNSGAHTNKEAFKKNLLDQTREMIRIHRNHPSIIAWSMGNELWFMGDGSINDVVAMLTSMANLTRTEDSTRQVGVGGTQLYSNELSGPVDISGFNGGWVNGADINGSVGKPTLVAEYGSCTDGGTGYQGCWGDNIQDSPSHTQYGWRAGGAIWCAFDHGSNIGTGLMGMINNARVPQKRWYFYRNLYLGIAPPTWPANGTPAKLKLTTDRDIITDDGLSDAQLMVEVQDASGKWLSNSPDITLTDLSGLGAFPTGSPTGTAITFHGSGEGGVPNGQAAIEFRSYNAGTVTIEASSGSLPKTSLDITVLHVAEEMAVASAVAPVVRTTYGPREQIVTVAGSHIRLPDTMSDGKVVVSLFDIKGRMIGTMVNNGGLIRRRNGAQGITVVKARMVK
ncbi:MAG: hypothetical protein JW863_11540 [Chitinispirillaceae bacterium]|nr:hypothetical protein [Chitinispirillaceae bacterium]